MSDISTNRERPLSPHLQVYKLPMIAITSILHRITGVGLVAGLLMLSWMIIAAATGEEAFKVFTDFAQTHVGLLLLFGWSLALYYHLCNGIRHLFWDMGYLFKIKNANRAGYVVLIATFILTVGTWCYALVNHATCFGGL